MGGMFSKPKMPKIEQPPKPPQINEAAERAEEADRLASKQGRAAAIISGADSRRPSRILGSGTRANE